MELKLHNTLSQQKETFTPITKGKVSMYVCGPTVYDRPHIGNARSVVVYDTLFRILNHLYGKTHVRYVRNITDVDDKINARAGELGVTIQELTSQTYQEFTEDMTYLGCLPPTYEPRATEHIQGIIEIIERLIDKNHAYLFDNHVYFDITSAKNYGDLSGRSLEDMLSGVRIEVSENKRHPGDFVLWKPSSLKDDPSSVFNSPWGMGRPGWHIECSAMSHHFLGTDFDIHGGGIDLIFPHHTNEIAQSCCAFPGSKFARYWVHNGFLTVSGEKMSKSLGNFLTVYDLIQKDISGDVIRYLLLSTHYRKPLDFNQKALYDAQESVSYIKRALESCEYTKSSPVPDEFLKTLLDDMNTPAAFSKMHDIAKTVYKTLGKEQSHAASELYAAAQLVGLLDCPEVTSAELLSPETTSMIKILIEERAEAKKAKNWARADEIRNELASMGIELEDKADGNTAWKKH